MSGLERCYNSRCEDFNELHHGMCKINREREKVTVKHTLSLDLTKKNPNFRGSLEGLLKAAPESATFTTIITVTPKDRPWESEQTSAVLQAEWED